MRRALVLLLVAACGKSDNKPPGPTVHATAAFVDITVVPMDGEHELAHQTVLIDGDLVLAPS